MSDLHVACLGCVELVPATLAEIGALAVILLATLILFGAVAAALARYNR